MSRLIPGNQKHLSLTDRQYIETSLNNHVSFQDIARYLCKDPTTISKEVRKYRLSDFCTGNGLFYNEKNHCIHRFKCTLVNVCHKILDCNVKCRSCPTCNQTWSRFEREWAAKYGDDWTLHYSLLVGMDIPNNKINIANPYGYNEEITVEELLSRTSFEAYENMPLFFKMAFAISIFEKNTVFTVVR